MKAKPLVWTLKQVQCFVSSFESIGQILIHQLQCSDFVWWRLCGAMRRPAQTPERNLECAVGASITRQMASFQVAIIAALGEMRLQLVCKLDPLLIWLFSQPKFQILVWASKIFQKLCASGIHNFFEVLLCHCHCRQSHATQRFCA